MKGNLETQFETSGVVFSLLPPILIVYNIHAYIDAGTAALVVQFLIAFAVTGLFFIKGFWRKIINFFKGNKKSDD